MGFEIKKHVLIRYTDEPDVTEITVPDGVTEIGKSAFYGCKTIQKVTFPDSLKIIRAYAFFECPIKEFIFPSHMDIQKIEGYALGSTWYDYPVLIFTAHQRKTKIRLEGIWVEWNATNNLLNFFREPNADAFSELSLYKPEIALAYYDTDDVISEYLKQNAEKIGEWLAVNNDTKRMNILLKTGFLKEKHIQNIIDEALLYMKTGENLAEVLIMLMDYQYQHFPADASRITKTLKL